MTIIGPFPPHPAPPHQLYQHVTASDKPETLDHWTWNLCSFNYLFLPAFLHLPPYSWPIGSQFLEVTGRRAREDGAYVSKSHHFGLQFSCTQGEGDFYCIWTADLNVIPSQSDILLPVCEETFFGWWRMAILSQPIR